MAADQLDVVRRITSPKIPRGLGLCESKISCNRRDEKHREFRIIIFIVGRTQWHPRSFTPQIHPQQVPIESRLDSPPPYPPLLAFPPFISKNTNRSADLFARSAAAPAAGLRRRSGTRWASPRTEATRPSCSSPSSDWGLPWLSATGSPGSRRKDLRHDGVGGGNRKARCWAGGGGDVYFDVVGRLRRGVLGAGIRIINRRRDSTSKRFGNSLESWR